MTILVVLAICGITVVTLAVTVGITLLVTRSIRKTFGPDRGILERGIPARARIISARQTGVMVNYQPQVSFQLEVEPPSGTPYHAETKAVIPMVNIPQFQPGGEVSVKIHPTDPTKVVLDLGGM
jgi:hypothetical protein